MLENIKKMINSVFTTAIVRSVFLFVFGLVLTLFPGAALGSIVTFLGSGLIVIGLINIFSVILSKEDNGSIISGVLTVVGGLLIIINSVFIISVFPFVIGFIIFINSLSKLSEIMSIDDRKYKLAGIISTMLILVFSIIILFNPFNSIKIVTIIMGILLMMSSILEIIKDVIFKTKFNKGIKKLKNKVIEAEDYKEK